MIKEGSLLKKVAAILIVALKQRGIFVSYSHRSNIIQEIRFGHDGFQLTVSNDKSPDSKKTPDQLLDSPNLILTKSERFCSTKSYVTSFLVISKQ